MLFKINCLQLLIKLQIYFSNQIFDFGLARTVSDGIVTGYVSTRLVFHESVTFSMMMGVHDSIFFADGGVLQKFL